MPLHNVWCNDISAYSLNEETKQLIRQAWGLGSNKMISSSFWLERSFRGKVLLLPPQILRWQSKYFLSTGSSSVIGN